MKIKFLLFAAIAGMSLAASAQGETFKDNGDRVYAEDVVIQAGGNGTIKMYLERKNSTNFTNIQCNFLFPDGSGIRPRANSAGLFGASGGDVKNTFEEDGEMVTVTYVNFSDNMDVAEFYPWHTIVGANQTKTRIEKNPNNFYNMYIKCDADAENGDYYMYWGNMRYTDYEDNSYHNFTEGWGNGREFTQQNWCETPLCKITIEGGKNPDGVNDINVSAAKTYKTIENGQVVIVKDGVKYNTMGQAL